MPKLLADFLLEQQEPFALEVYLVERGYPKRLTFHNSAKYVAPNCSYFVRAAFSRLVVATANGGRRNFLTGKAESRPENAARDGFSAASTSCSECDATGSHCSKSAIRRFVKCGNCFLEREVDDADTNSKLRAEEEDGKQQLSPALIFGETDLDQDSPIYYNKCNYKTSSSTLQCKLKQPRRCVSGKLGELNPYDQHILNKMALQQREWLQVDCTQESIENYRKKGENVIFEQQKYEISMEIENAIFENVIHEIVTWLDWKDFIA